MPICDEPGREVKYVLPCDQGLPDDRRPEFYGLARTRRQMRDLRTKLSDLRTMTADIGIDAINQKIIDGLRLVLTGWRNVRVDGKPLGYSPENVEVLYFDVLSESEAWDVLYGVLSSSTLTETDRKNFGSPLPSAGAPAVNASA